MPYSVVCAIPLRFSFRPEIQDTSPPSSWRKTPPLSANNVALYTRKLTSPVFPVSGTLAVAAHWAAGKVAGATGDTRALIEQLEMAVTAEDAIPYMEPSYWPIPVRPALGAALLQAGDAAKAEHVFREDLKRWPRNGWSLFGLAQSLRRQGKSESSDLVWREFETAWKRADVKLTLEWF